MRYEGDLPGILRQGSHVWNGLRDSISDLIIDIRDADLRNLELDFVNLSRARLSFAIATFASFQYAEFQDAVLDHCIFDGADFREANFSYTIFDAVGLSTANFTEALFNGARFAAIDLSSAVGLEEAIHDGPSSIGLDTLDLSRGLIPEPFLRGCGLSDVEIEFAKLYRQDLTSEEVTDITYRIHELRGTRPIQLSPVFISYAHKDAAFVDELENHLNTNGIRFWRDTHDLKAGRLETQIDRAIRLNPVVILVLSQHSVESDWVEYEASKARELEKELKRDVLCPVALDDAWKSCRWPGPLRRQIEDYNVLDFSQDIDRQFAKLKDGLGLYYVKPGSSPPSSPRS